MGSFARGMQLGAGLVALGYGTYRLAKGRRGLMTSASLSTGATMILGGLQVRGRRWGGIRMAQAAVRATNVMANPSTF